MHETIRFILISRVFTRIVTVEIIFEDDNLQKIVIDSNDTMIIDFIDNELWLMNFTIFVIKLTDDQLNKLLDDIEKVVNNSICIEVEHEKIG